MRNNNDKNLSAMRYLTMIVALAPSVSAFAGVQNRPTVKASEYADSGVSSRIPHRRKSVITSKTRLNYISGANPEHTKDNKEGTTWWNSIFAREESSAADDYLEFLDRRYNRILKDEEQEAKGFSVMNWLSQSNNNEPEPGREEDALYVLGVANLASKKFLQKHHMPSPDEDTPANDKTAAAVDAEIVEVKPTPVPVAAVVTLFRKVAAYRDNFVRRQNRSLRVALACILKSAATSPVRAAQKLFNMGGGKESVAMTFAALAALFILLRPILKVAATQGAKNTMRP